MSRYSFQERACIGILRTLVCCSVLVSIRAAVPHSLELVETMKPIPISGMVAPEEDDLHASETALLEGLREVGYGRVELKIVGGTVQGWWVKSQTIVLAEKGE
jgi:hypothetical protein